MASSRKNINKMIKLKNENGVLIADQLGMSVIAKDYFVDLFHESHGSYEFVTGVVTRCIIDDDNLKLTSPFSLEEFPYCPIPNASR